MLKEYDIVISGGGLVGASLACALADSGYSIAVLEAVSINMPQQPSYDDRGLALSLSSERIFRKLSIWDSVADKTTAIQQVHVSDKGRFGKVRMDAASLGLDALGHVVIARELGQVLLKKIDASDNIDFLCPAKVTNLEQNSDSARVVYSSAGEMSELSCKLIVAADGTHSALRKIAGIGASLSDYGQTAIVTNITPEMAHANTAFERFTETGPLALLPMPDNRCVLVNTVASSEAEHYLEMSDEEFRVYVQQRFGKKLGKILKTGSRRSYPIVQLLSDKQYDGRILLLGNAVHTLHPNAAQGFNLCLRDVAGLVEVLVRTEQRAKDPGAISLLQEYVSSRQIDQRNTSKLSATLADWFYSPMLSKALIRNSAMTLIDLCPPVKKQIIRRGMGISGRQPEMVQGL